MTMVIVTHEMAFARDVANHVIFMDDALYRGGGYSGGSFQSDPERKNKSSSCRDSMTDRTDNCCKKQKMITFSVINAQKKCDNIVRNFNTFGIKK